MLYPWAVSSLFPETRQTLPQTRIQTRSLYHCTQRSNLPQRALAGTRRHFFNRGHCFHLLLGIRGFGTEGFPFPRRRRLALPTLRRRKLRLRMPRCRLLFVGEGFFVGAGALLVEGFLIGSGPVVVAGASVGRGPFVGVFVGGSDAGSGAHGQNLDTSWWVRSHRK